MVIENDYRVCKRLSSRIREDLRRVGFVANAEKSIWEPVQSIRELTFRALALRRSESDELDSLRRRASARNVSPRISLRWPIHIINLVDKTKLSYNTPTDHRRSTTVSLETYPLSSFVKSIVWLGFCGNSLLSITERRLNKIFDHIQNITNNYYGLSTRQLASFTGKIISTGLVFGNVSRIMTMSVAAAPDWDSLFKLDQYCINVVEFWKDNIIQGNVRYCFGGTTPNCFVYSDASGTGCGAHMTLNQE